MHRKKLIKCCILILDNGIMKYFSFFLFAVKVISTLMLHSDYYSQTSLDVPFIAILYSSVSRELHCAIIN